jgi:hypothetical protein
VGLGVWANENARDGKNRVWPLRELRFSNTGVGHHLPGLLVTEVNGFNKVLFA